MKMNKEELKKKIDEFDVSDDVKIAMLEDIEDSFVESEPVNLDDYVTKEDYEKLKAELEDSKRKYKERFFDTKEEIADAIEEEKIEPESEDEEKVIDVKEIFSDEDEEEKKED